VHNESLSIAAMCVCNQTAIYGRNISTRERSEAIFASSAPCAGVVSNLEKLLIRRQSFLSATIADGKVGLNQSDHLVEASNRMHVDELRPRKDHHGVDLISDALPFGRRR
jgi:hypothetical protein